MTRLRIVPLIMLTISEGKCLRGTDDFRNSEALVSLTKAQTLMTNMIHQAILYMSSKTQLMKGSETSTLPRLNHLPQQVLDRGSLLH